LVQQLKPKLLRSNCNIYSCLAFAFVNFISKLDDVNSSVSQKTITYIETFNDSAMKSIILCLELQFDTVIYDRPIILQSLYRLFSSAHHFKSQVILTWEFFMQRFNTISLETQITREKNGGEALAPIDICGVSINSPKFQQKLYVALFALLRTQYVRKISSSMKLFQLNEKKQNIEEKENTSASFDGLYNYNL